MELVLVGLPGSGKSVIGRRLAARHRAEYVDLDEVIEREAGRPIHAIFAEEGEAPFRRREREAVASLGAPEGGSNLTRIVAAGGGTPVDPRNRWVLYRGRIVAWLDGPPEVLAQRLRRSVHVRPLVAGRDPIGTIRGLGAARRRFYAPGRQVNALAQVSTILGAIDRFLEEGVGTGTVLLRAETPIGTIEIGEGNAEAGVVAALGQLEARRALLVSEPRAWEAAGERLAAALQAAGYPVERLLLPRGEDAKRLAVIETAASELARLRVERAEPLVAIGGGALGDAAGFLAATYLRGVPVIHVPTTLVAQIDSSIGGKTAVDIPEGKNLVGAFHQPAAVVIDTRFLATLAERERRAALGEAVKMGVLADERLLELLEASGEAIATGDPAAAESGAVAELVERCAWAKVEVVIGDQRDEAARLTLNLGHSLGHAVEAAAGYNGILHGEAVAYGLRGALAIGRELGITPPDRADRIERLLDRLDLAIEPPTVSPEAVRSHLGVDKKHAGGRLRWILPAEGGVVVRSDVPEDAVEQGLAAALRGSPAAAASTWGSGAR